MDILELLSRISKLSDATTRECPQTEMRKYSREFEAKRETDKKVRVCQKRCQQTRVSVIVDSLPYFIYFILIHVMR